MILAILVIAAAALISFVAGVLIGNWLYVRFGP